MSNPFKKNDDGNKSATNPFKSGSGTSSGSSGAANPFAKKENREEGKQDNKSVFGAKSTAGSVFG